MASAISALLKSAVPSPIPIPNLKLQFGKEDSRNHVFKTLISIILRT